MKIKGFSIVTALLLLFGFVGCLPQGQAEKTNRLEEIKRRGYITVATEPYFAPYQFIDPSKPENDKYVGSDIELAQYIADSLGVELRIVPLEFSAVIAGVVEGKYDLAISALAYTPERENAMILSRGYYFSKEDKGHGLLVRTEDLPSITGADKLGNKIIVVQSGSLQEKFLNEQVPAYGEVKRVSATTDGFLMVQEHKADVCLTSVAMAELYISANPDCGLSIVEGFKFSQDAETDGTRIGIPPGEKELEAYVNERILELLESGQYEQWYLEYKEYAKTLGL